MTNLGTLASKFYSVINPPQTCILGSAALLSASALKTVRSALSAIGLSLDL